MEDVLEKIGITDIDKKLLKNAFVHRSYLNENKEGFTTSYERLEFLGDSVLSLITSEYLFTHFTDLQEGAYTDIKASIVRTESLAFASKNLKLGELILLSSGEELQNGRENENTLADVFEAVIAVLYLHRGLEIARKFVHEYLFKNLDIPTIIEQKLYLSPKNRLQEIVQRDHRSIPEYKIIKEEGPEHKKTFTIQVSINNEVKATATGKSKKQAEEAGAKEVLKQLEKTT